MKKIILLLLVLSSYQSHSQQPSTAITQLKDLHWLVGSWKRTNDKPGRTTIESWEKLPSHELTGRSVTLRGQDTVFVEKFNLIIKDNVLYYAADVPENKKVIYFRITEASANGFVCENPEHDFPKKINYKKGGDKLNAQISGDGKAIDFFFEKMK